MKNKLAIGSFTSMVLGFAIILLSYMINDTNFLLGRLRMILLYVGFLFIVISFITSIISLKKLKGKKQGRILALISLIISSIGILIILYFFFNILAYRGGVY